MAKITISELRPTGADLFEGSESFLQELTDNEIDITKGGGFTPFTSIFTFPFPIPQLPVPEKSL